MTRPPAKMFRNSRYADRRPTGVVYSPHMAAKKTTRKELGEMLAHVVVRKTRPAMKVCDPSHRRRPLW
jgi:hypothetical protein